MEEYILKKGPFSQEIFNKRLNKIEKARSKMAKKEDSGMVKTLGLALLTLLINLQYQINHGHYNTTLIYISISSVISAAYFFFIRYDRLYDKIRDKYWEYKRLYETNSIDIPLSKISNHITTKSDYYIIDALESIDKCLYYTLALDNESTSYYKKEKICQVFRYRGDVEWRLEIGRYGYSPILNNDDYNFLMSL